MIQDNYKNFVHDILCVLVLYKTPPDESAAFLSLYKNTGGPASDIDLFIWDNSPGSLNDSRKDFFKNKAVQYFHSPSNEGVSKAYNEGFKLARTMHKKWIMLADQDTDFPEDLFDTYVKSISDHPDSELFVPRLVHENTVLSPCRFLFKRGSSLGKIVPGRHQFNKLSVLNSGILVSVQAFEKTGGYNEKIKLDFADFYFIDQFKKRSPYFVVTRAVCQHNLSSGEKDFERVLNRFNFYCNGAKFYSYNLFTYINLLILCFFRATKLSLKYRRLTFYNAFLKYFLGHSIA